MIKHRVNEAAMRCSRIAAWWFDWEARWNAAAKHLRKCTACKKVDSLDGSVIESCPMAPPFPVVEKPPL